MPRTTCSLVRARQAVATASRTHADQRGRTGVGLDQPTPSPATRCRAPPSRCPQVVTAGTRRNELYVNVTRGHKTTTLTPSRTPTLSTARVISPARHPPDPVQEVVRSPAGPPVNNGVVDRFPVRSPSRAPAASHTHELHLARRPLSATTRRTRRCGAAPSRCNETPWPALAMVSPPRTWSPRCPHVRAHRGWRRATTTRSPRRRVPLDLPSRPLLDRRVRVGSARARMTRRLRTRGRGDRGGTCRRRARPRRGTSSSALGDGAPWTTEHCEGSATQGRSVMRYETPTVSHTSAAATPAAHTWNIGGRANRSTAPTISVAMLSASPRIQSLDRGGGGLTGPRIGPTGARTRGGSLDDVVIEGVIDHDRQVASRRRPRRPRAVE